MKSYDEQAVYRVLPEPVRRALERLPQGQLEQMEELRMRQGFAVTARLQNREVALPGTVLTTKQMLDEILERATDHSAYAASGYLRQGFVTIPGGHRIGFSGHAVLEQGQIKTLRDLSSVSIRIARRVPDYARQLRPYITAEMPSVLIIGPPGAGKTSLLRELVRLLSDDFAQTVSLIDERFEIAACRGGRAVFEVGCQTDILSGCPKAAGIEVMLRTMAPQWLAVDEITAADDIQAMQRAGYCGVRLAATAHAANFKDLNRRILYRQLLRAQIFGTLITLDPQRQLHVETLV